MFEPGRADGRLARRRRAARRAARADRLRGHARLDRRGGAGAARRLHLRRRRPTPWSPRRTIPELRAAVLGADFTVPDGQPLVGRSTCSATGSPTASTGPTHGRACARAVRTGRAHVPLRRPQPGRARCSSPATCGCATRACRSSAGTSPPFRPLTPEEEDAVTADIRRSARRGRLGRASASRKQEKWMARMSGRLEGCVLIGVGAAFDFHAGLIPPGARADAAARPRVALPPRARAAPPLAALPALQPALRHGLRAPVGSSAPASASMTRSCCSSLIPANSGSVTARAA